MIKSPPTTESTRSHCNSHLPGNLHAALPCSKGAKCHFCQACQHRHQQDSFFLSLVLARLAIWTKMPLHVNDQLSRSSISLSLHLPVWAHTGLTQASV